MIFRILLICFSYFSICASGQDALLVIASHSEGVLVDNAPVSVGQLISSNTRKLLIPKNGFAVVITKHGSHKLTKSLSVTAAVKEVKELADPSKQVGFTIVERPNKVNLIGMPSHSSAHIFGDSILIALKPNYDWIKPPYKIQFADLFGSTLSSDSIHSNWKVFSVKSLFTLSKEKHFLFEVKGHDFNVEERLVKRIEDTRVKPLNDALSAVTYSGSSEILKLAILESNNLQYDHTFLLYQLTRSNYKPENEILAAYFNGLKEKYNFDLFNFKE